MVDNSALRAAIRSIIRTGDPSSLTIRMIKRQAEQKLGLDENHLDEPRLKADIKAWVAQCMEDASDQEDSSADRDVARSAETEPEPDEADPKQHRAKNGTPETKAIIQKNAKVARPSDDKQQQESRENSGQDESASDGYGMEESDDDSSQGKADTRKRREAPGSEAAEKKKRQRKSKAGEASTEISEQQAATIRNLQNYVGKCGVKKFWAREYAGMNGAERIRRLKEILKELGIEGRPTLSQCEKIKKKIEWQKEQESLDLSNIIESGTRTRARRQPIESTAAQAGGSRLEKKPRHVADEDSDDDEERATGSERDRKRVVKKSKNEDRDDKDHEHHNETENSGTDGNQSKVSQSGRLRKIKKVEQDDGDDRDEDEDEGSDDNDDDDDADGSDQDEDSDEDYDQSDDDDDDDDNYDDGDGRDDD
ncbi:uncharacterized protein BJ171DRAFT_570665 [Polychytrium aggregatum]|uniref:uncharacterized protein n=1 Tax=Polychytrium aggregatum TaxID=110093 RepID=UPI0022FEFAD3|nr:uncharacterized protein BJ171DRAFT_570665 [Polychytrium aggregatum]KAI9197428.1 hypothetical protein BJ171DRAFT_570665 [Polychytrium aggregatum]